MAKYRLNREEEKLIRYMSLNSEKDEDIIKCQISLKDAADETGILEENIEEILKRLEEHYFVTELDDGSYVISSTAFDEVNTIKSNEEKVDDGPLRLNDDAYNYDEEIENEYESIELEFSDLRADESGDPDEYIKEKADDEVSKEEIISESKEKKKENRSLNLRDYFYDEPAYFYDSAKEAVIDKNITVGVFNGADGFRLNNDSYRKTEIENVYENQHIDFSDLRGGDIKDLKTEETYERSEAAEEYDEKAAKQRISDFSAFTDMGEIKKVTESGQKVKISSVTEDNIGPIVSEEKGVVLEGGRFIHDESIKEGFSSYENTEKYADRISVSTYRNESLENEDREKSVLTFDAIKRVSYQAEGETQYSSTLNGEMNSVYSVNTQRTQDIEKNSDLRTAEKEAEIELIKNFHTYDFAKLARDSGINELKSIFTDVTVGIQGSYTDDMMPSFFASAGIASSVASKALFDINRHERSIEDKAILLAEKLKDTGTDINTINRVKEADLKRILEGAGFTEKESALFIKKANFVAKEYSYRQDVIKRAKTDAVFLSGDKELKDHLIKKGFRDLSANKQIEILNELNKTNKNAEIRNLDLRKLNKKQIDKLLKEKRTDLKSRKLLLKTRKLRRKADIEKYAGIHGLMHSVARRISVSTPSEQDIFGNTVKDTYRGARNIYDKAVIRITAVKVSTEFARKAYKSGKAFVRVGNKGFVKIRNKSYIKLRQEGTRVKLKNKVNPGTVKKVLKAGTILKAGKDSISDSLYQSESEAEEKKKKERRSDLTNRISGAVDNKKTFGKDLKKSADKTGGLMKNAAKGGFKKAGKVTAKKAGKETAKNTVKAGLKAIASKTTGGGILSGALAGGAASFAVIIAIVVAVIIIILFIMYIFDGLAMAGYESSSVVKDDMSTFGVDIGKAFSDGIHKLEHTAILVSDKSTDNDEYIDIKDYLKRIQELDETREKNALTFANARIGTYSAQSMGLEARQLNGKYGQDASILAGHTTQYYGSEDKKNGYTLHYIDAYGNEIANHSSNAKDVMSLCAVLFSNQPDEDNVFMYLIEDVWYLLSPEISWKESDIYCCDTCSATYNGYGYDITTCRDDNYSSKYAGNGEVRTYYCNDYSDVSNIQNLIRRGCKVEGDVRGYDSEGCRQREVSRYFHGDGYDTYDLYLDGYISYEDYRWYVDYYGSELSFSRTFTKTEWYCDGNHKVAVCYGHKDIDIYITVYDREYATAKGIYPTKENSRTGRYESYSEYLEDFLATDRWRDEDNIAWVDGLYDQDWYDIYGLDVLGGVGFTIGGTLSDADIDSILNCLSEEELSVKQQAIIEFALKYVGKIPYYWGGKADSLDFESNKFGSVIEADYKGRTRKGLDCSGFIQWVMANNGIKVPGSTAGYSGYSVTKEYTQLKVGDLGLLNTPGSETNHIGIYAGQDENGNDLWIHCAGSSGTVVNNYNGFRYYISLGSL